MSDCPFCNPDPARYAAEPSSVHSKPSVEKRPAGFLRRTWRKTQWLFPAAGLVLIPKCPMCVAAYMAMFTGIGVSVSAARWIQIVMLALCVGSLAYLAGRARRNGSRSLKSGQNSSV